VYHILHQLSHALILLHSENKVNVNSLQCVISTLTEQQQQQETEALKPTKEWMSENLVSVSRFTVTTPITISPQYSLTSKIIDYLKPLFLYKLLGLVSVATSPPVSHIT
jgi:hypothetical protein